MPQPSARGAALLILAERDEALAAITVVEPPEMDVATFKGHLAAIMRELEKLKAAAGPEASRLMVRGQGNNREPGTARTGERQDAH